MERGYLKTYFLLTHSIISIFPPQERLHGTGERRSNQVLTFQHIMHPYSPTHFVYFRNTFSITNTPNFTDSILDTMTQELRPDYIHVRTLKPRPSSSASPSLSPRPPPRRFTQPTPQHYVHLMSFLTKHWQLIPPSLPSSLPHCRSATGDIPPSPAGW